VTPAPPSTPTTASTSAILTTVEIDELLAEAEKVDRILARLAAAWLEPTRSDGRNAETRGGRSP
jgi:hypothetical protein